MEIIERGVPEDRIAALEKKTGEMEALLKGLVAEMLDFKALAKTLARQDGDRRQEPSREPAVQDTVSREPEAPAVSPSGAAPGETRTVIRPHSAQKQAVAAEPAAPEMVRIMQSDGTMKLEARRGDTKLRR